jgi:hypothetical protein
MAFSRDRCNSSECRIPIDPTQVVWGFADIPYNYCSEQCLNDAKNKYIPDHKIGFVYDFEASVQRWFEYMFDNHVDSDGDPYYETKWQQEKRRQKALEWAKQTAQEYADEWNRTQQAYIAEATAKLYDRLNREYQAELREQAEKERVAMEKEAERQRREQERELREREREERREAERERREQERQQREADRLAKEQQREQERADERARKEAERLADEERWKPRKFEI